MVARGNINIQLNEMIFFWEYLAFSIFADLIMILTCSRLYSVNPTTKAFIGRRENMTPL